MSASPSNRPTRPPLPLVAGDGAVLTGVGLMLVAGVFSSLLHLGVRFTSPEVPAVQIVFLRSMFTLAATLPFLMLGGGVAWRTKAPRLHMLRGAIGVCSMWSWYWALANMPLADAGVLSFTTVIFVTIGAAMWFAEPVGLRRWMAVIIGLIGAAIVLKPGAGLVTLAALAALGSSLLWAVVLLMAKEISRYDSTLTITFYQPLMIAPFAFVGSVPVWVWPSGGVWLILAGMGLVAGLGNYCYVQALRTADASVVMPADYVRLLWMVAWGYWLFAEVPGWTTWLGAALIIGSTLFIAWREGRLRRRQHRAS
ncbi:MAG: DMT family transporter [Hyphomicrobiaceae bacterium]